MQVGPSFSTITPRRVSSFNSRVMTGSLGIAPTAKIDLERRYPSMFEPIHGSAFDIMGQRLTNPIGTFCARI